MLVKRESLYERTYNIISKTFSKINRTELETRAFENRFLSNFGSQGNLEKH